VPVGRRTKAEAETITHVQGDGPARIGKINRDRFPSRTGVTGRTAGHGHDKDGSGQQPAQSKRHPGLLANGGPRL
jgi:hypothetical protein